MKCTKWFPGHIKPVIIGWYQVRGSFAEGKRAWRVWDGRQWLWSPPRKFEDGPPSGDLRLTRAAVGTTDHWRGLKAPAC